MNTRLENTNQLLNLSQKAFAECSSVKILSSRKKFSSKPVELKNKNNLMKEQILDLLGFALFTLIAVSIGLIGFLLSI